MTNLDQRLAQPGSVFLLPEFCGPLVQFEEVCAVHGGCRNKRERRQEEP
jgi:hypothetical protein